MHSTRLKGLEASCRTGSPSPGDSRRRLRCLAKFAANDFTAAARRTLAAFAATFAGGSVRMMRSARLPVDLEVAVGAVQRADRAGHEVGVGERDLLAGVGVGEHQRRLLEPVRDHVVVRHRVAAERTGTV